MNGLVQHCSLHQFNVKIWNLISRQAEVLPNGYWVGCNLKTEGRNKEWKSPNSNFSLFLFHYFAWFPSILKKRIPYQLFICEFLHTKHVFSSSMSLYFHNWDFLSGFELFKPTINIQLLPLLYHTWKSLGLTVELSFPNTVYISTTYDANIYFLPYLIYYLPLKQRMPMLIFIPVEFVPHLTSF